MAIEGRERKIVRMYDPNGRLCEVSIRHGNPHLLHSKDGLTLEKGWTFVDPADDPRPK